MKKEEYKKDWNRWGRKSKPMIKEYINKRFSEIGAVCRVGRVRAGYSQKEMEQLTGINQSNLSLFERGFERSFYYVLVYEYLGLIKFEEVLPYGEENNG